MRRLRERWGETQTVGEERCATGLERKDPELGVWGKAQEGVRNHYASLLCDVYPTMHPARHTIGV